jgi:hypothetical protein
LKKVWSVVLSEGSRKTLASPLKFDQPIRVRCRFVALDISQWRPFYCAM